MGNVNGRGDARPDHGRLRVGDVDDSVGLNGVIAPRENRAAMISQQMPIAPPTQKCYDPVPHIHTTQSDSHGPEDPDHGVPVIVTWNYGGNDVLVEGSWDDWTSRKRMQRSGKDCSILLVLPPGIYHYRFIVDGEHRYVPELPHMSGITGHICNLLDVREYMPENPESIAEFETPPSPESSYSQVPWTDGDFAKEPPAVPPQLHLTVLGPANADDRVPTRPQHVVLNHLFQEKGLASQSVVALGLTHRFESKYVTVVLYKPVTR